MLFDYVIMLLVLVLLCVVVFGIAVCCCCCCLGCLVVVLLLLLVLLSLSLLLFVDIDNDNEQVQGMDESIMATVMIMVCSVIARVIAHSLLFRKSNKREKSSRKRAKSSRCVVFRQFCSHFCSLVTRKSRKIWRISKRW